MSNRNEPFDPKNVPDILRRRADATPDQIAYRFLADGEDETNVLRYGELDRRARAIAATLRDQVAPGDRVLLVHQPGLDFIEAFLGCLYAGAVAVPAYPPDPGRLTRTLPKLRAITLDAAPRAALTTTLLLTLLEGATARAPELAKLPWLASDDIDTQRADDFSPPEVGAESLAMLQYTSGSTGRPKGVMLSHGNLIHNQRMIRSAFEHSNETVFVGWLPLYHDMGLIGMTLQAMYLGIPYTLMSPNDFLRRPARWLEAITRYRGTTSGGPNFAFDLCVRKVTPEEREQLDLRSWDLVFNGAEPVRRDTLERFAEMFEPVGFRRQAFYPCYGLAEASLIVAGGRKAAPPVTLEADGAGLREKRFRAPAAGTDDTRWLVSSGRSRLDQRVRVVDPETRRPCDDDRVGEIWVCGPSVGRGYWNEVEETKATFRAELADGEGPFLRTGDLGFLHEGELFVTGRNKDLVIVRGRNYYPHDLEHTAELSHPALRQGCAAAFSLDEGGEEQLIIVQEVKAAQGLDADDAIAAVRRAVVEEYEIQASVVMLIEPRTIYKTSSGKVQRGATRDAYLAGSLRSVAAWRAADAAPPVEGASGAGDASTGASVIALARGVTRRSAALVTLDTPFEELELDSIARMELAARIEERFQIDLSDEQMAGFVTLREVVRHIEG